MLSTFLPCSANYTTYCSRETSRHHALHIAAQIEAAHAKGGLDLGIFMTNLNLGQHNVHSGFFPFVFDDQGICRGHGARPDLLGKGIGSIVQDFQLYMDPNYWLERFKGGGFVSYLFRLDKHDPVDDKVAYVVPIPDSTWFVAVGWINHQLPTDPFCSNTIDAFCSFQNVLSIVGWGQSRLNNAKTREGFESAIRDLSVLDQFRVRVQGNNQSGPSEDFALFLFDSQGQVLASEFPDQITRNVTDLFARKGYDNSVAFDFFENLQLSVASADGGWFRYAPGVKSPPTGTELPPGKVVHSVKISYGGDDYFLGAEFDFKLPKVPSGTQCSPSSNHPCAFQLSRYLAAHTIAHLITAESSIEERFEAITNSESFRPNDFYAFFYSYEDDRCVAHGGNPSFVNRTLPEVFELVGNDQLNAEQLRKQFKDNALRGSGFSVYDWVRLDDDTAVKNRWHQKMSFIYLVELDGQRFIGGVGFDNKKRDFDLDPCKNEREPKGCNSGDDISLSLLGETLSHLILASSEASATTHLTEISFEQIEDVYKAINAGEDPFVLYGFSVTVISFEDHTECYTNDNTGCIIASSSTIFLPGETWQETLDRHNIAEESGDEIHLELMRESSKPHGFTRVPWTPGTNRKFWVARFAHDGDLYYAFVDYDEVGARGFWVVMLANAAGAILFSVCAIILFVWCRSRQRRKDYTTTTWKGAVHGYRAQALKRRCEKSTDATRTQKIFLCHRGPDSKETIARPTYHFLVDKLGLPAESVFFDDELKVGKNRQNVPEIEREAGSCTLAIVVISDTFRDSPYSVGELNIFEQRLKEEDAEIVVLPVLWGITNAELSGYSTRVRQLININSCKRQDAASFLREKLWPKLIIHLGKDPDEFTNECFVEFLCDYIKGRRGLTPIPLEFETFCRSVTSPST